MNIDEAIKILIYYNKWRRGKEDEIIYTPKEIGKAIDILVFTILKQKNKKDEN